jgi:NADH:ubiquinone oxidoreductase subunit 4 (subunit M)
MALQFIHQTEWNTRLDTTFTLGLDGFSYPLETIINELGRMGLPQADWSGYLERLALELPG